MRSKESLQVCEKDKAKLMVPDKKGLLLFTGVPLTERAHHLFCTKQAKTQKNYREKRSSRQFSEKSATKTNF